MNMTCVCLSVNWQSHSDTERRTLAGRPTDRPTDQPPWNLPTARCTKCVEWKADSYFSTQALPHFWWRSTIHSCFLSGLTLIQINSDGTSGFNLSWHPIERTVSQGYNGSSGCVTELRYIGSSVNLPFKITLKLVQFKVGSFSVSLHLVSVLIGIANQSAVMWGFHSNAAENCAFQGLIRSK
jgi:hypothetical protein